ncbi:hypothetical protein ZIOFF_011471 [Zingiber officinale]|uniref:non-specific serine/threonine protein kinase n=1 Tax=Zingiber officinale TaxID=94328 RepID=A0A8J5HN94_ZINOF|nr:hypothetical protein ZIOFF_011471 [Zingiber officinale]
MEKYEVVKDLGAGNFGVARLMRNKDTNEFVAMKYIPRGQKINENVAREIINHRSLCHPNIIRFKEVLLTPTHLAIVMEYAAGGELFERICLAGRFSEDEVGYLSLSFPPSYPCEIFLSAAHLRRELLPCHGKTIASSSEKRNLSEKKKSLTKWMPTSANLPPGSQTGEHLARRQSCAAIEDLRLRLLQGDSFHPSLSLFHQSSQSQNYSVIEFPSFHLPFASRRQSSVLHSRPKSTVGTPAYIAPEVLSRREYDGKVISVTHSMRSILSPLALMLTQTVRRRLAQCSELVDKMADVWSCGVTLYVMLVGAYPFEDLEDPKNFKKTMARIVSVQYKIPEYVHISRDCRQLLSRILVADPSKRITISEIRKLPWFLKNLPRELTEVAQSMYYKRDTTNLSYSPQSGEEIMSIVEEARSIVPSLSTALSDLGFAKEDELEGGLQMKPETKEEDEEDDDDEYEKRVKEVHASGEYMQLVN